MSAMRYSIPVPPERNAASSFSTLIRLYMENSPLPTATSFLMPYFRSWRQSSHPMLPPAPVMSTVLPANFFSTAPASTLTSSLPIRSEMPMSRREMESGFRSSSSKACGSTLIGMDRWSRRISDAIRLIFSEPTDGMAMMTSLTARSRTSRLAPPVSQKTILPFRIVPTFSGSSSTKPAIILPRPRLMYSDKMTRPASPAPTTSTFLPRRLRTGASPAAALREYRSLITIR